MSGPSDFERIARDWLAEGPTELADRVLDATLTDVRRTRQRRPLTAGRFAQMSGQTRAGVAIAAAIVLILGAALVLRTSNQAPVAASPAPSASPSPSRIAAAPSIGPATGPRVTMNDKGCYGENLEGLRAGQLTIEAVSTTDDSVAWDLLKYDAPHTWADAAAVVVERQQIVAAGGPAGGAADWMGNVASANTSRGSGVVALAANVPAGNYLVVCVGTAPDSTNTAVFIVGPIPVAR
jgi:hypothetical protein